MQKDPEKLEGFFQTMIKRKKRYDIFRDEKDLQAFQSLFIESNNFEHNMITYLSNSSKFKQQQNKEDSKELPLPPGPRLSAEDKFVERIVNSIDQSIGSMKHFAIQSAIKRLDTPTLDSKEADPEIAPSEDTISGSLSHTFDGKDWNYSAIDSLASKIEKAEDLEVVKIDLNNVLQVGKGKLAKLFTQLKKHESISTLDIGLDRSKLTKLEIDEIVKYISEVQNLLHFGLSISG
jgi:hypothetical protein